MTTPKNLLLLDLNATLSENFREVMKNPSTSFEQRIVNIERYRQWLADYLVEHKMPVCLFTVRRAVYQEVTLENIRKQTGLTPCKAMFSMHEGKPPLPPIVKGEMLERLFAQGYRPDDLFAFESNASTRSMMKKKGVRAVRIQTPDDLPDAVGVFG